MDVFLSEAKPEDWPGHGLKLANMDSATRGNLLWVKKNVFSTLMVATKVQSLIGQTQGLSATPPPIPNDGEEDAAKTLDDEIAGAEREAAKLMERLQTEKPSRKAHGKA